eukprot:gene11198-12373_t
MHFSDAAISWEFATPLVPLKGTVTITCDGSEDIDVYHKNVKLTTGTPYTITKSVSNGKTTVGVEVSPVLEEQAGEYICQAAADASRNAKASISIQVKTDDSGKVYNKAIGSKATVEFYIVGIPRPKIYYYVKTASGGKGEMLVWIAADGTVTKGTNGARYSITKDKGYLVIDGVQEVDGRDYTVVATSRGVSYTFGMKVNVGAAPKLTTSPAKSYKLTSGVEAVIPCTFEAAPTSAEWKVTTSAGTTTTINPVTSGNIVMSGTSLKITSPARSNEGDTYECIAKNIFGTTTANTSVALVYEKPVIAALASSPVKVIVGASVTLVCKATGNPLPVVEWSHKASGGSYSLVNGQKKSSGASNVTITNADASHAGDYKCVAYLNEKKDLNDTKMLQVELQTPPKIDDMTTVTKMYPVGLNKSNDLICAATGTPLPKVMFMKGGKELSGAVESSKTATKLVMTLAYVADKLSDAGVIKCVAKSSIGNDSRDITIQMIDKPTPPSGLAHTKIENSYVDLKWNAVAGSSEYTVFKDGKQAKKSTATQARIASLDSGKSYSFTVAAKNMAGYGSQSSPLVVKTLMYGKPSEPLPDTQGSPTKFDGVVAKLQWRAPTDNGGDASLKYVVKYCSEDSLGSYPPANCKTTTTNTTSVTVRGLKEKTNYQFSITAKNARDSGTALTFVAKTGSAKATPPVTKPVPTGEPEPKKKKGLSGGKVAAIVIAVILFLLIIIDLFCCFFNECGFSFCCYQACCAGKGKGKCKCCRRFEGPREARIKGGEAGTNDTDVKPEAKEEEQAKAKKTEDV